MLHRFTKCAPLQRSVCCLHARRLVEESCGTPGRNRPEGCEDLVHLQIRHILWKACMLCQYYCACYAAYAAFEGLELHAHLNSRRDRFPVMTFTLSDYFYEMIRKLQTVSVFGLRFFASQFCAFFASRILGCVCCVFLLRLCCVLCACFVTLLRFLCILGEEGG